MNEYILAAGITASYGFRGPWVRVQQKSKDSVHLIALSGIATRLDIVYSIARRCEPLSFRMECHLASWKIKVKSALKQQVLKSE